MGNNYVEYETLLRSMASQLKFNCVGYYESEELYPYVTPSLDYINGRLILSGSDGLEFKIKELRKCIDEINQYLIDKDVNMICYLMGFDSSDFDLVYFTMLWTSLTTTMLRRIDCNYAGMFDETHPDCVCPDTPVNTTGDMTEYRPISEAYDSPGCQELWRNDEVYEIPKG